jgi:hypothetical protein
VPTNEPGDADPGPLKMSQVVLNGLRMPCSIG